MQCLDASLCAVCVFPIFRKRSDIARSPRAKNFAKFPYTYVRHSTKNCAMCWKVYPKQKKVYRIWFNCSIWRGANRSINIVWRGRCCIATSAWPCDFILTWTWPRCLHKHKLKPSTIMRSPEKQASPHFLGTKIFCRATKQNRCYHRQKRALSFYEVQVVLQSQLWALYIVALFDTVAWNEMKNWCTCLMTLQAVAVTQAWEGCSNISADRCSSMRCKTLFTFV